MSVALLLVTHDGIGTHLLSVAERMLGRLSLPAEVLEVPFDADPQATLLSASSCLRRIDQGDGVLLLTDIYGASPANAAARLMFMGTRVRRVAGLNLPMLLRSFNYPDLDLDAMAAAAATGGRMGVIVDDA